MKVKIIWRHWAEKTNNYIGKSKYKKIIKQIENNKISYIGFLFDGGFQELSKKK